MMGDQICSSRWEATAVVTPLCSSTMASSLSVSRKAGEAAGLPLPVPFCGESYADTGAETYTVTHFYRPTSIPRGIFFRRSRGDFSPRVCTARYHEIETTTKGLLASAVACSSSVWIIHRREYRWHFDVSNRHHCSYSHFKTGTPDHLSFASSSPVAPSDANQNGHCSDHWTRTSGRQNCIWEIDVL